MDSATGSQDVQAGDGNVQTNLFADGHPRGPVVRPPWSPTAWSCG